MFCVSFEYVIKDPLIYVLGRATLKLVIKIRFLTAQFGQFYSVAWVKTQNPNQTSHPPRTLTFGAQVRGGAALSRLCELPEGDVPKDLLEQSAEIEIKSS